MDLDDYSTAHAAMWRKQLSQKAQKLERMHASAHRLQLAHDRNLRRLHEKVRDFEALLAAVRTFADVECSEVPDVGQDITQRAKDEGRRLGCGLPLVAGGAAWHCQYHRMTEAIRQRATELGLPEQAWTRKQRVRGA